MSVDQMEVIENTTIESVHKSNKDSTLMEFKNSNGGGASLCPITPNLTKENVKSTLLSKVDEDDDGDPSTPMEDVIDPCASDPHKLMLDPNQMSHSVTSVARKLEFSSNDCVSQNEIENGSLMETVYESVLEGIIRKQAEDILAEILDLGSSHEARDVLMTPPSAARISGLAETCPGAPLKPKQARKLRTVDISLCRKLDFDSYG